MSRQDTNKAERFVVGILGVCLDTLRKGSILTIYRTLRNFLELWIWFLRWRLRWLYFVI